MQQGETSGDAPHSSSNSPSRQPSVREDKTWEIREKTKLSENTAVQTAVLLAPSKMPNAAGNSQNQGVTAPALGAAGGSVARSASKHFADFKMEAGRGKAASPRMLS